MERFDVIIIGSGAGGGTLLRALAETNKSILVLERGPFLPREKANWTFRGSFNYYSDEVMLDRDGGEIRPGFVHHVGGNTKVYGAALFRLREKDFEALPHVDGVSPEWPIKYADFEPWYAEAERLYTVHGEAGHDPTEPARSGAYPYPPISHEPRIQTVFDQLRQEGLSPFPSPMGIQLDERAPLSSKCIRCDTCDGYPCLLHAKSDAEVVGVRPVMDRDNVTLVTETRVVRLETDGRGRRVDRVVAEGPEGPVEYRGDVVVVACGAVHSAALLLASASDAHPQGLANRSGQVGRNLMKHVLGSMLGVSPDTPNPTAFQKTLAVNDFYFGSPEFPHPMGNVQLMGRTTTEALAGQEQRYAPLSLETVAANAVDWWLTTEDLPRPDNRVRLDRGRIVIDYRENNTRAFEALVRAWTGVLERLGEPCRPAPCGHYFNPHGVEDHVHEDGEGFFVTKMPVQSLGHQVGTCRFGRDPDASVLDVHCRAHDVDNLYVVDGSFFVSSAAVNPTLTIIANALRVGAHLTERL